MKQRPRNGWAAALLALAMLLTCFPAAALAGEAQLPEISNSSEAAALFDSVPDLDISGESDAATLFEGDAVRVGTWDALKEAMQTGGDIVLTADVKDTATKAHDTDNGYLFVPEKVTVTLDLAGHTVDRNMGNVKGDGEKGVVIWVERDASLTIKDSSGNDSGKITGGYSDWNGGILVRGGTLVLDGGSITGNRTEGMGAGVTMDGGSFTMNGGKISGNSGRSGVCIRYDAVFIMNDGEISGNTTTNVGGGVAVEGACSFTMNGGEISGNTAARDGGGVWTGGGATFMMNGGKISGNTAGSGGGVSAGGTFVMSGGEISGNTATEDGGGVWLNYAKFTLSGGKISNNTAARNGGGVMCFNDTTITMSGGEISGNKATGELNPDDQNIGRGGGVYCHQELTMSGGEISGNTAKTDGGGIYYDVVPGYEDIASAMSLSGTAAIKGNAARNGGGVYFRNPYGTKFGFTMSGGEISGNAATENGGGVFAIQTWNSSENPPSFPMLLSGGAIKNNQAKNGGGVYNAGNFLDVNVSELSNDDPKVTLTVTGGEISGNKATENGGGVFCAGHNAGYRGGSNYDSAVFAMSGGRVADNSAVNGGGAYHEAGDVTLSGGEITGNNVTQNGGGVFVVTDSLTVSGPASVTGNHRGGDENNVYLKDKNLIHVGGKLDGAKIGVSADDPEQREIFTGAYKSSGNTENPASALLSDNDLYTADFSANGNEAELFRTIRKQDITLSDADGAAVTASTYAYDGAAKTPAVKATWSGETLAENTDYTVSYADNVNASDAAAVTITGKGAYHGAVTVNFRINKAPITPGVSLDGWTYGESAKTPAVTGNPGNGAVTYSYAPAGSTSFSEGVPTNAGTYTVKAAVAETDNYRSGEASAEFTIAKADITPSVSVAGWAFGANPNAPAVTGNPGNGAVTYSYAPKGTDSFSTTAPTAVGAYTVKAVIAESANYNGGETSGEFTIAKADITPSVSVADWAFGETPNAPAVTGNPGDGAVTYSYAPKSGGVFSGTAPTAPGTYTVKAVIAETESYNGGEASADFTIELAVKAVTVDGASVRVSVACGALPDASVYCAAYRDDGTMLSLYAAPVTGAQTYDFQFGGAAFAYAKAFLLDGNLAPLCAENRS